MQDRIVIVCFVMAALSGCALGPTPYQAIGDSRYGYSDQRLESDRYRVSFKGNDQTDRDTVQNYLLFRAAEITLANHYRYFRMMDQTVNEIEGEETIIVSAGQGWYNYPWIFGTRIATTNAAESRFEAGAQFKMLRERPESDDGYVFDAQEIKRNVGPLIVLPDNAQGKQASDLAGPATGTDPEN